MTIPIIDFAAARSPNQADKDRLASQVSEAYRRIGFLYARNLGVTATAVDAAFSASRRLFDLPTPEKQAAAWSDSVSNTGYVGPERESLDPSKPPDLKEAFNIGSNDSLNTWPEDKNAFRHSFGAFFDMACTASNLVLEVLARSLNMPEFYFVTNHNRHQHTMRLLHYFPILEAPKAGQMRAGAHSDYGTITLLFQDERGGLEVRNRDGTWVDAPAIDDTVLINAGDLLQRWTGDLYRSTEHRVRIPKDGREKMDRYSIVLFCHPNDETVIERLESCRSGGASYPPITARQYLIDRLDATY